MGPSKRSTYIFGAVSNEINNHASGSRIFQQFMNVLTHYYCFYYTISQLPTQSVYSLLIFNMTLKSADYQFSEQSHIYDINFLSQ
jgi:hypothetical protein